MQPVPYHVVALPPVRAGAVVRGLADGGPPDSIAIGRYVPASSAPAVLPDVVAQPASSVPDKRASASRRGDRHGGSLKYFMRRLVSRLRGRGMPIDGLTFAAMLRAEGRMKIGDHCSISPGANITDPDYVVMGDNVRLSDCSLFGHDGSINMINRALGTSFDAVGPIVIGDNVFIGHGTIVLPGTTIGSNTIIGAGSVVKGQVAGGHVYVGSPLRAITSFDTHVKKLEGRDRELPGEWRQLLEQRAAAFDPVMEPRLIELRRHHFFGASA